MAAHGHAAPPVPMDFFLVLDFEATCDNKLKLHPQEIIEFPVLKVNAKTMLTEAIFHSYVQPDVHAILTPFCTELTGITQAMVDGKPLLKTTLEQFHKWMNDNGLLDPSINSCFVTCGDWDLKTMLPSQCHYLRLSVPHYFQRWVNIKRVFEVATGQRARGMPRMLQALGLELEGRHHSGIDDSKNIARILGELAKTQNDIQPTTVVRV